MIQFLSGALTVAYLIAGAYFLRFWKRTSDRLFLHFALAFGLFTLNEIVFSLQAITPERVGYTYILRTLGFVLIIAAIVDKNRSTKGN